MRAVRLLGARTLSVEDLPDPVAADGEAIVRVAACGICGSDLSCYKTGVFAGAVLGHELSGTVLGGAGEWEDGARVVADPKTPCGACDDCRAGAGHRCVQALTRGIGQERDGGFAEHVSVPAHLLRRVPAPLDLVTASLAEPLAVALHGLARAGAGAEPSVVFGLGPIGLLAVAALRDRGADPIVGVDPVPHRRALALSVGATEAVAPGDARIADAGAPLVVETSGVAAVLADAGNAARPGARVAMLGVPMASVEVWPMVWVTRELTLVGSIAHTAGDWDGALDLLAREPGIGAIITERVTLHALPDAFERLIARADAGKIVAVP